jgi:hypothetical protein
MSSTLTILGSPETPPSAHTVLDMQSAALSLAKLQKVPSLATAASDDLDREVYCLQGFPVDAISMQEAVPRLLAAMGPKSTYMISTPNLNFLTLSQSNAEFRESLWQSDLCPPDGMSLIGIARLLGIPLKERVAGSDIFEALVARKIPSEPIRVFLFGVPTGSPLLRPRHSIRLQGASSALAGSIQDSDRWRI